MDLRRGKAITAEHTKHTKHRGGEAQTRVAKQQDKQTEMVKTKNMRERERENKKHEKKRKATRQKEKERERGRNANNTSGIQTTTQPSSMSDTFHEILICSLELNP